MDHLQESSTHSTPSSHYTNFFSQHHCNQFKEDHINGVNHHSTLVTTVPSSYNLSSMFPTSYYKLATSKQHPKWTAEEDSILVKSVDRFVQWSHIATLLNGKTEEHCRERWYNYYRPDFKDEPWSEKEENILIEARKYVDENNWSEIARRLPGRSESSIYNHWNAIERVRNANNSMNKVNNGNQLHFDNCDESSERDYEMELFLKDSIQEEIDFMKMFFNL